MSRASLHPRWRAVFAGLAVAALVSSGASPAHAESVLIWDGSTDDFDLVVTSPDGGSIHRVDVTNLTDSTQYLGFGADLVTQGTVSYFWNHGWSEFRRLGSVVLEPGQSHTETLLPAWSGMTYSFFSSIDSVPTLIGEYTNEGLYLPFNFTFVDDGDDFNDEFIGSRLQVGPTVSVLPDVLRAGEDARIVTDLGADWPSSQADVWIMFVDDIDLATSGAFLILRGLVGFSQSLAEDPEGIGVPIGLLGSVPVVNGVTSGSVQIPEGISPSEYVVFVGDYAEGLWHAGPALATGADVAVLPTFVVEEGEPRSTTSPGTNVPVAPLDQFGATPVTFTFDEVTEGGTTTVRTSTSGPAPTAFTLLGGSNAVYYELSTTATFTGNVTVCLTYDPTGLSEAQQAAIALFHYTEGAWVNITQSRSPGEVCGVTTSFSPFVLGIPVDPDVDDVVLTSKEECKKGGWATSTAPVFTNQGACVSYFATQAPKGRG